MGSSNFIDLLMKTISESMRVGGFYVSNTFAAKVSAY